MRLLHLALPQALLAGLFAAPAIAEEARYLDDRSSAVSVVQSFYNAVNRKEYARAWAYFGDEKPVADLDTFASGYEDTERVNVITGNGASEGAAGSVFHYLPVSILASGKDGSAQVFAGCYVLRLADPAIQASSFTPLHIEKAQLEPSDKSQADALPENCPDAPEPEQADVILEQARTLLAAENENCAQLLTEASSSEPRIVQYRIPFHYSSDGDDQPEREARLIRFFCGAGAYNETHVYYQHDEEYGLRGLQFVKPELDIRYESEDSDEKVKSIDVIGYITEAILMNSSYDEATLTLTSAYKWRGIGDASDSGIWIFRNGRFTLVGYEVDASYDGEINPESVLDFHTAP